jgi:hypothetical protein
MNSFLLLAEERGRVGIFVGLPIFCIIFAKEL